MEANPERKTLGQRILGIFVRPIIDEGTGAPWNRDDRFDWRIGLPVMFAYLLILGLCEFLFRGFIKAHSWTFLGLPVVPFLATAFAAEFSKWTTKEVMRRRPSRNPWYLPKLRRRSLP